MIELSGSKGLTLAWRMGCCDHLRSLSPSKTGINNVGDGLRSPKHAQIAKSVAFAVQLLGLSDGFYLTPGAFFVINALGIRVAKIGIGPVPGCPEQTSLRNAGCANQRAYQ